MADGNKQASGPTAKPKLACLHCNDRGRYYSVDDESNGMWVTCMCAAGMRARDKR